MSPPNSTLRVLVVDDSALYRKIVRDVIDSLPGVEVVGVANNGRVAVDRIAALKPDVITLDFEMPVLDGIGVLRELAGRRDAPAAIMVSAFTASGAAATTTALQEGAFDFILKPATKSLELSVRQLKRDLTPRLQACRARAPQRPPVGRAAPPKRPTPPGPASATPAAAPRIGKPEVIGVGVSTGGPQALTRLLPKLPADLPCPIALVQHMPPMFTGSLARDLDKRCRLTVREGENGMPLSPGEVVIAPGGKQMRVGRGAGGGPVIQITDAPPVRNCKPAVDYLFDSLAGEFGQHVLGVVLTGMGDDGAAGATQIKQRGGSIISQDEASCVVYGMPRAVADAGVADLVLPLDQIAERLVRITSQGFARGGIR